MLILVAMSVSIELQHVIRAGHMKSPWIPETRVVGDRCYVRLCKWDRGFVRYVTSKGLDFGDRSTFANAEFFDELCSLRNQTCDNEFKKITQDDEQAEGNNNNKRQRKSYIRKARASDNVILPACFEIKFPSIPGSHGDHTCSVLIDGIRTSTIYVELTTFNLEHIRAGILQSKPGRSRGRRGKDAAGVEENPEEDIEIGEDD